MNLKNVLLIVTALLVFGRLAFDAGWIPIQVSPTINYIWLVVAIIGWAAVVLLPFFRGEKSS